MQKFFETINLVLDALEWLEGRIWLATNQTSLILELDEIVVLLLIDLLDLVGIEHEDALSLLLQGECNLAFVANFAKTVRLVIVPPAFVLPTVS